MSLKMVIAFWEPDGTNSQLTSQLFELGFFTPNNNSHNQYVGIWFKEVVPKTVIWVANREKPVANSSSSLTIGSDGNLRLVDGQQNTIWSTNVSGQSNGSIVVLSDEGKLVLNSITGEKIWDSSQHPTDSLLPGSWLVYNDTSGERLTVTSWKSDHDPSVGDFTVGVPPQTPPQAFVWKRSKPHWRSGHWDKSMFIGIPEMEADYQSGVILVEDIQPGSIYLTQGAGMLNGRHPLLPVKFMELVDLSGNLLDMHELHDGGKDLNLRLAHIELEESAEKTKEKIIISVVTVSSIAFVALIYGFRKWRANRRARTNAAVDTSRGNSRPIMGRSPLEDKDSIELPLFDFDGILVATNNFDLENKLGQGGYGPVYKGTLQDGKDVAIKRLSSSSGQGMAWTLWSESKGIQMIDEALADSFSSSGASRCVNVGLLCVQDNAADRPTMSAIVSMLTGEKSKLPEPKQPTFTFQNVSNNSHFQSQSKSTWSVNNVTESIIEPR
ncbi:hypothetical protein GH714_026315 [Hevea brasiliensis]|uniref:Bulb-type lectin domain-containing protein n=1 Tax=Hevea brasiliensis TaxID=3981 RepID=A0A6A6LRE5_HEVBR|nr:hypothetical protein GH714_026315 [Hevea brasiliensis]